MYVRKGCLLFDQWTNPKKPNAKIPKNKNAAGIPRKAAGILILRNLGRCSVITHTMSQKRIPVPKEKPNTSQALHCCCSAKKGIENTTVLIAAGPMHQFTRRHMWGKAITNTKHTTRYHANTTPAANRKTHTLFSVGIKGTSP